jgi:hypothetical protein
LDPARITETCLYFKGEILWAESSTFSKGIQVFRQKLQKDPGDQIWQ